MLDTNMVSYIARGRSPAARSRLLGLNVDETACISTITEAEVRFGLAKRPQATALKQLMQRFLANINILPWESAAADAYAQLRTSLEATGQTLGSMDLLIAAHAMATGAVLVTNDSALSQLKGLRPTQNWASDLNPKLL